MKVSDHQTPIAGTALIIRATRAAIIGSVLSALALQVSLVARGAPSIQTASLIAFAVSLVASLLAPKLGPALVLSVTYVAPAAIAAAVGTRDSSYLCVWLAALVAPVVPTLTWREWRFPPTWRAPLVLWLLCVAAVWPLIVLRECNFDLRLLSVDSVSTSGIGIPPWLETIGITQSVLALALPLLWLDWLCGVFPSNRRRSLVRWVIAPLAVSWLISAAAGLYQGFVDMLFLNGGLFGYMGRASGTMVDANPFGVVTAMWGPALFALAVGSKRRAFMMAGAAAWLLSWIGVWASGSRTATVTAGIALLVVAWHVGQSVRWRKAPGWVLSVSAAVLVVVALLVAAKPSGDVSGFSRLRATLPSPSIASVEAFAAEMWNRNHYGEASTRMIREFPLVGVGLGAFSTLVVDYGRLSNGTWLTPDNAQNWYRHQLAQMGIAGSLGWILWIGVMAAFVWRTWRSELAPERRFEAGVIAGTLAGVAIVSLVGMPTANTAAALTVMVFVFWYVATVDPDGRVLPSGAAASDRRTRWSRGELAAGVLLLAFLGGTAFAGWTRLRPPQRAVRFGWEYVAGFYDHERAGDGALFRWTTARAVDVVPVTNRYVRLRYRVNHPDVEQRPVGVKVWIQDRLVIDETVRSVTPLTAYVSVQGEPRVMIETRVSRTWRPVDYGQPDSRELGLAMDDWTFVSEPPPGAAVVTDARRSPHSR